MNWLTHFQKELKSPTGFSCGHCVKPLRCCDFTPFFPNFLVGASLTADPSFIQKISEIDASRLHPLGIFPPNKSKRVCDFFEAEIGACRNWSYRPSECVSFYCGTELESAFKEQSYSLFNLELYISQLALNRAGYSSKEVNSFIDHWNEFLEGKTSEYIWSLSTGEKLNFYQDLWRDINEFTWSGLKTQLNINEIMTFEKHLKVD